MKFRMHMQVLSDIGLKGPVDHGIFLECAKEVNSWPLADVDTQQKQTRIQAARALVHELNSNTSLQSSALFTALKDLAFVPAVKVS